MSTTVARINITLPLDLTDELREVASLRTRSRLIAEALREKLIKLRREKAIKKLRGSWERFGGVKFDNSRELNSWRRSLWASTNKKLRGKSD